MEINVPSPLGLLPLAESFDQPMERDLPSPPMWLPLPMASEEPHNPKPCPVMRLPLPQGIAPVILEGPPVAMSAASSFSPKAVGPSYLPLAPSTQDVVGTSTPIAIA